MTDGRGATLITSAAAEQQLARGALEVVRVLERREAQAIFLACDLDRDDLAGVIRRLAREASVPLVERYGRKDLGKWAGIERPCSAVAVLEIPDREAYLAEVLEHAPGITRSLSDLQMLVSRLRVDSVEDALGRARGALEVLSATDSTEADRGQAVAAMLRAVLVSADHTGVDLQRLVDRWTLAEWLRRAG